MKSRGVATVPFEIRERVHRTDVDPSGLIDFSAYARFIEIAETEFFRSIGFNHAEFARLGISLSRVHVEFEFYKPALLDDELILSTSVRGVGVHSVRFKISIGRAGTEGRIAEATVVASCVDAAHHSAALPESMAEALRAQLVTT